MTDPLMIAGVLIALTIFLTVSLLTLRYPHYSVWVILYAFIALPEYQVNQDLPIWMTTWVMEVRFAGFNLMELVILWSWVLLLLGRIIRGESLRLHWIQNRWAWMLLLVWSLAAVHGVLRWFLSPVGDTTVLSAFGAFAPICYIFLVALLVEQLTRDAEQLDFHLRAMWIFFWVIVLRGVVRLIMIEIGYIQTLEIRLPIVIYREAMFVIYVLVLFFVARRMKISKSLRPGVIITALVTLFLFLTTRRIVYIIAVVAPVWAIIVGYWTQSLPPLSLGSRLKRLGGVVALLGLLVMLIPSEPIIVMIDTFRSINIWSETGIRMASGAERVSQVENLFANLEHENSWLFGTGLGTYWREYIPVPHSPYTGFNKILSQGATSFPAFVLPGVNLLYRLGILGSLILFFVMWKYLIFHIRKIRRVSLPWYRAQYISLVSLFFVLFFFLGDTRTPSTVFAGVLLGLGEAIARIYGDGQSDLMQRRGDAPTQH
jgi:hypothetical protein